MPTDRAGHLFQKVSRGLICDHISLMPLCQPGFLPITAGILLWGGAPNPSLTSRLLRIMSCSPGGQTPPAARERRAPHSSPARATRGSSRVAALCGRCGRVPASARPGHVLLPGLCPVGEAELRQVASGRWDTGRWDWAVCPLQEAGEEVSGVNGS